MAHFITKPKQNSLKYYIFSTIVMGAITKKMYRAEMLQYLKDNDYGCWLDADMEKDSNMEYWNGDFWFVTEEDGYYV